MDYALHWVRKRQRALTRAVLALFCLAWLQAAALPCVMAHSGPPPASQAAHCPYCPPADSPATDSDVGANCTYPHSPQVDARVVAALFVPVAPIQFVPLVDASPGALPESDGAAAGPGPRIPLSVSYCRFIE